MCNYQNKLLDWVWLVANEKEQRTEKAEQKGVRWLAKTCPRSSPFSHSKERIAVEVENDWLSFNCALFSFLLLLSFRSLFFLFFFLCSHSTTSHITQTHNFIHSFIQLINVPPSLPAPPAAPSSTATCRTRHSGSDLATVTLVLVVLHQCPEAAAAAVAAPTVR